MAINKEVMMRSFPKYLHINNLSNAKAVLDEECIITEKAHGTSLRFMYDAEAGFVVGSRENVIYHHSTAYGNLFGATEHLLSTGIDVRLRSLPQYEGYVFYGEWYGDGVQKGVKYCDGKQVRLFDVCDPDGKMLDWDVVIDMAQELGLPTMPVLHRGPVSIDLLNNLREGNSTISELNGITASIQTIKEGIVIKPVKMKLDSHGNYMIAKYKSDKWAENAKAPKVKELDQGKLDVMNEAKEFAASVITPGRVETIIDHITRNGNEELSMGRTKEFIEELIKDIQEEYAELYQTLGEKQLAYNKALGSLAAVMFKGAVHDRAFDG